MNTRSNLGGADAAEARWARLCRGSLVDRNTFETDAAIGLTIDDETQQIWEKWEEMFSGEKDEPISTLFNPPLKLFPAERLDDDQIARSELDCPRCRSKLDIHHIDEGIAVLRAIDAPMVAIRAYCVHPLVQGDADLATTANGGQ